jgi:hypothetical protein
MGNEVKQMKLTAVLLFLVLLASLIGCAKQAVEETGPVADPTVEEPVAIEPEEEPPSIDEAEETIIEDEKQLSLGTTDMKEEELSIISDVKCVFGPEGPENFSFRMTNTEEKEWKFSPLSYKSRETADNPVVILNALQVTNAQLIESCGRKSLQPGATVVCDFNINSQTNAVMKNSLRTGLTAMGNENKNSLTLKTAGHAAEVMFLC